MKQIRNNVFETNSSSTHSITLQGLKDKMVTLYEEDNIEIRFGEYGWEQEQYYGYQDKLSYVLTMIQYHLNYKWDSKEVDKENIVNTILSSKYYEWLGELVWEYCKKTISVKSNNDDWCPAGYVDHQSTDVLDDWWSEDKEQFKENMKQFIFNEKYGFVTDNDNH